MVLIRLFEDAVQRLFMQGEIQGTTHLFQGQEAVSVGVCAALQPGDAVAAPTAATARAWRWARIPPR
jgi:TPP-dependent pyruvate/acetoin dehydrogenase alpha subunit